MRCAGRTETGCALCNPGGYVEATDDKLPPPTPIPSAGMPRHPKEHAKQHEMARPMGAVAAVGALVALVFIGVPFAAFVIKATIFMTKLVWNLVP